MDFQNFTLALANLLPAAQPEVLRIINGVRPPQNYVWNGFLPEQQLLDFDIKDASLRIIPTMAGIVGMDSPYPPGGVMDARTFTEEVAKIALTVPLKEAFLRKLYKMSLELNARGGNSTQSILQTLLNFSNLVLGQAQLDTMEWLRGVALTDHKIDWQFGDQRLTVDYKIDAKYRLAARTGAAGYGGTGSVFWADVIRAQQLLKHDVVGYYAHPDTVAMIVGNDANNATILSQNNGTFQIVQRRSIKNANGDMVGEQNSDDARYQVTLNAYGAEGEIINPADPKTTLKIPFMRRGKIVVVGRGGPRGFEIGHNAPGQGAQVQDSPLSLGYTHIAPTVEGGFSPGRWGRVFTPQDAPWAIQGDTVCNGLPVLQSEDKLVTLTTDMV